MDLDPKKRPAARDIIDRLDETASTIETTSISSSSTEQQVNILKEQYCQEKTSKLAADYSEKDNKEQAEIEELVEYVRKSREDHWQQGQEEAPEEWLSWEAEYTEQNVSPQASATISSSNSGMLYKLNNLNIFDKARRNYVKNGGPILEKISSLKLTRTFGSQVHHTPINHNSWKKVLEFKNKFRYKSWLEIVCPGMSMPNLNLEYKNM
jgi:uncharacterized protein YcbK (DUF882 family)